MMRGFQIWPHKSNRIIFDPFFGLKTVQNTPYFGYFAIFGQLFWPKKGSNIIRFEF